VVGMSKENNQELIMEQPLQNTLTWRPCDLDATSYRPEAEKTVLIYDGYLDDVVMGHLDVQPDWLGVDPVMVWYGETTGDRLPDPQLWSDVPFPDVPASVQVKG
jgi:hypothetical protein